MSLLEEAELDLDGNFIATGREDSTGIDIGWRALPHKQFATNRTD